MRTTSDPQDEKLKFRLNKDLKDCICDNAYKEGVTVSEYLRELIRWAIVNKK